MSMHLRRMPDEDKQSETKAQSDGQFTLEGIFLGQPEIQDQLELPAFPLQDRTHKTNGV